MSSSLKQTLLALDQGHLFDGTENDSVVLKQLEKLNTNYPGGLSSYIERARDLLAKSKRGENPFTGYTPHVPLSTVFPFSATSTRLSEAERVGREAFKKCAFVLVAGGLGERLGYSGIKVELPSETTSSLCFLGLYCSYIKSLQSSSTRAPLAIMTSDDTHTKTVALLEREEYFGLARDQVHLIKQEKVASLMDDQAHIAIKQTTIVTKPHGHGDVHLLLHQSGLAKSWKDQGLEWLFFFQDTNPHGFRTFPASLGVSVQQDLELNFLTIPRKAKSAAGGLMRLCHEDGHEVTINVEYNYIESLLRSTISPEDGDVNGPNGYSMFPGNMNQLIFKLGPYVANLEKTGGAIAEFVNPKYQDETRTTFKSPTRLECMMQDYALTLRGKNVVGVTIFEDATYESTLPKRSLTHRLYAPAKNNLVDAEAKAKAGVPDASTTSTELSIYACNCLLLKDLGCDIEDPVLSCYGGIQQPEWAHVVFHPSFLPLSSELKNRFLEPEKVKISSSSTLVLQGSITFSGVFELDGALVIQAVDGAQVSLVDARIKNEGWHFTPVGPDDDEVFQIRGFKHKGGRSVTRSNKNTHVLAFEHPGKYVVTNLT